MLRIFFKRLWRLVSQPMFIALTVFGNTVTLAGALIIFHLENGVNPQVESYLDALWWAVSTVTTVGYGDVAPITSEGKIFGIFMMVIGTALFGSYTALFAEALLAGEISDLESELQSIERRLRKMDPLKIQNQEVQVLLSSINTRLSHLIRNK